MARKLREMLGTVAPTPQQAPAPTVRVPEVDTAKDLATAAESGFAAIQALFAERNRSVELCNNLQQHNVYLLHLNNGLAAELKHARAERDHYMRMFASGGAHLRQAYAIIGRMLGEVGHTEAVVESMAPAPIPTNNPTAPAVDEGPLEVDGPPPVDQEELKALAVKLAAANGHIPQQ